MHHALQPTPGNCGVAIFLIVGIVGTARNQIASQVVGLVGSTLIGYLDRNRTEEGDRTWQARTQQVARLSRRLWAALRRSGSQEVIQRPVAVVPLECIVVIQDLGGFRANERRNREDSLNGPKRIDPQDLATTSVSTIETDAAEPHAGSTSALRRRRPHKPQRVHFPERGEDLQSVHLFEPDETEAQVEVEFEEPEADLILDTSLTSPIPCPSPSPYANVHLETLQLLSDRPYTLCGSVLVRNVSPAKYVAIRYTLDEWPTTSETMARYEGSLGVLPPPLEAICNTSFDNVGWDRFNFYIPLEHVGYSRRLADKVLWLCVRFGGESVGTWWVNNDGANYRVVLKKEVVGGEA